MQFFAFVFLLFVNFAFADNQSITPPLLLANKFHQDIKLNEYWVSEKFDGVRAYWNGTQFISRQGHVYLAPSWFTRDFPHEALDGELWLKRGGFEQLSGIVRTETNNNPEWKNLHYLVFDAPHFPGTFNQRLAHLHDLFSTSTPGYIYLVEQKKVPSMQLLQQQLQDVVDHGGEGLMLHRGESFYKGERSDDLLKLKPFDDAEAIVLQYIPGKGKYSGMMGSLEVVDAQDKHFRIGIGFTDSQRKNPPAIGSTITYRFNGLTKKGLPRFPRFLRIRNDW